MAKLTASQMRAHILRLAADHHIRIKWRRDASGSWAAPALMLISIPPIRSATTYAVALHEIGHLFRSDKKTTRMACERSAWDWAQANAIAWLPAMTATRKRSLAWSQRTIRSSHAARKRLAGNKVGSKRTLEP